MVFHKVWNWNNSYLYCLNNILQCLISKNVLCLLMTCVFLVIVTLVACEPNCNTKVSPMCQWRIFKAQQSSSKRFKKKNLHAGVRYLGHRQKAGMVIRNQAKVPGQRQASWHKKISLRGNDSEPGT